MLFFLSSQNPPPFFRHVEKLIRIDILISKLKRELAQNDQIFEPGHYFVFFRMTRFVATFEYFCHTVLRKGVKVIAKKNQVILFIASSNIGVSGILFQIFCFLENKGQDIL